MELDYTNILSIFTNMITTALPIAIFLWLADLLINFFFSLAFPKRFSKGD